MNMSRPVEAYLSTKQSPLAINSNILVIVELEGCLLQWNIMSV